MESLGEFLKAGAAFVGVGTALIDKKLAAEKDWAGLTDEGFRKLLVGAGDDRILMEAPVSAR